MRGAGLLAGFGVEPDGDWAVVDEGDLHVCAEDAGGDGEVGFCGEGGAELVAEWGGGIWSGGADEGWAVSFFYGGEEGELGDDEEAAGDVSDGAVHEAGVVGEDAEPCDFAGEPRDVFGAVGFFDADEEEEALADGGVGGLIDGDGGGQNPLEEDTHGVTFSAGKWIGQAAGLAGSAAAEGEEGDACDADEETDGGFRDDAGDWEVGCGDDERGVGDVHRPACDGGGLEREGVEGCAEREQAKRGFHGGGLGVGERRFIMGKHDACRDGGDWWR